MSSGDTFISTDSFIPDQAETDEFSVDGTAGVTDLETSEPELIAPKTSPSKLVASTSTRKTTPAPVSAAATIKSKSKRKKGQPTVTMATAPIMSGAPGENTGRWTAEEHRLFLQGLEQHGKGWKKIASLIKSRTVVQIRTHAQKYFQKLAKARQNGCDDGDVSMEGRNGPVLTGSAAIGTGGSHTVPRRRQTTGTKRKALSSVVKSATRQGKKMAAAQTAAGLPPAVPPLPAIAPALAPFLPPGPPTSNLAVPSISTAHGTISGPALEDSLFRFLTPVPVTSDPGQVNDVARQVGANPITLPSDNPSTAPTTAGDISPTGVTDYALYPSWTEVKDIPSWYVKGADVDCLLDVADNLDWLADTGDLHETYEPHTSATDTSADDEDGVSKAASIPSLSSDALGGLDVDSSVALPTLFDNTAPPSKKAKMSSTDIAGTSESVDEHLHVFDSPMEEHAFVSALLENTGESSESLPVLG